MIYTGERLMPEIGQGNIEEHRRLYDKSLEYVRGDVLDIASGSGWGTELLVTAAVCHATGVDISEEAVEFAKSNHRGVYQVGSILDIPFADKSFDVVNSIETFEHICHDDVNKMISEVNRVLRHGGLYLFSTPDHLVYPYHPSTPAEYRGWHRWHYEEAELCELLRPYFFRLEFFTITKGHYVVAYKL